MSTLDLVRKNKCTPFIKRVAELENVNSKLLVERLKKGTVVIPANTKHKIKKPCAIGEGLRTKINANIGTSTDHCELKDEIKKLEIALQYGADTIMDLSVGGNLRKIRQKILEHCYVPLGTVPIYEIAHNAQKKHKDFLNFTKEEALEVLWQQAEDGVDFFTIHAGVTQKTVQTLKKHPRLMGIVSRGGAIMACWMKRHRQENPFFEFYDEVLKVAYKYDITLSLGDGLRPGSILDATDAAQIEELKLLGKLCRKAQENNVQVMIEGPGHIPLDQIKKNILLQKRICHNAPFYVLGPLVTDVALGYDEISSAIGGAIAASYGADFLCYVTPSEHLRHPSAEDVKRGVIASKIAAHAADIVKKIPQALQWDKKISIARKKRNWKEQIALGIDKEKAKRIRQLSLPREDDTCTMCGTYCAAKLNEAF